MGRLWLGLLAVKFLVLFVAFPCFETRGTKDAPKHFEPQFGVFFRNISFIHIPKNGGSVMENTIQGLSHFNVGFQSFRTHSMTGSNWHVDVSKYCPASPPFMCKSNLCANGNKEKGGICAYWHIPPYTYKPPYHQWLTKTIRFCHIRNPYTRAISELFFSHRGLSSKPLDKVVESYLPLLQKLTADKRTLHLNRKEQYYNRYLTHSPHICHNHTIETLSPDTPPMIIPFPQELPGQCFLNPHEHCHNIPESRFVEPYVTADYMQDLYYYLQQTDIDCYEILRILEEKHSTELTRGTGLNCNFPLRSEKLFEDFTLFLNRCGPLPNYEHGYSGGPSAQKEQKYDRLLHHPQIKHLLTELFWEDVIRFGYSDEIPE